MARLRWLEAPTPGGAGAGGAGAAGSVTQDPDAFLRELAGPTAIHVPGADRSRTRVAVTLSHGNEPSGFRAVHAWLRAGVQPRVDTLLIVTSVEAALREPLYSHRFLPGQRDLNRCFHGPFEGPEGELAGEVLQAIENVKPEAVIDLHNNSGHNPPYAVGPHAGPVEVAIARLFGERFVVTRLEIGALVEVVHSAPVMTIECGRSGDPGADEIARKGLSRFLGVDALEPGRPAGRPIQPMQLLVDPVRVRVHAGLRLAVGDAPVPDADLTLREDIDRHNFEELPAGALIGWLGNHLPETDWPLEARGEDGADRSRQLFARRGDSLETQSMLVPIMMTTDPEAAKHDCLFYAVRRAPESGAR